MKNKKLLTAFLLLGCLFGTSCNMDSISNNSNINSSINLERYKEVLEEFGISNFENIAIKEYLKEGSKYNLSNKLSNAGYNKKIVVYQNNKLVGSMYDGVVNGYGGPIHFQLFFKGEVCKLFRCLSHTETPGFGKNLLENIPNIINGKSIDYFEKNKLDSDFGSGSTFTKTPLIASICEAAIDYKTVLEEKNNLGDDKFNDNSSNSSSSSNGDFLSGSSSSNGDFLSGSSSSNNDFYSGSSSSNKEQGYEETLFGIDGASYEKVTLGALDENSNIKNVYIASVNDVEKAICYEINATTTWKTENGDDNIDAILAVAFNVSNDKILKGNAIKVGDNNEYNDESQNILNSFIGLDASVISEMVFNSNGNVDFATGATASIQLVKKLIIDVANQYINIDKLSYAFGVSGNFQKKGNATLPSETNIKNIYLFNNILGYELEKEVYFDTGYGNAEMSINVYVSIDTLTDKILMVRAFNVGTHSRYEEKAMLVAAQFAGLDVASVAKMTVDSHEGVDFVSAATISSQGVLESIVEVAKQYINVDKTSLK